MPSNPGVEKGNMKLTRSTTNTVFAGVCGGLAGQFGWSPTRLRVVWTLATIFTAFAGLIVYLALWYLMPKETEAFAPA
jgi:phage shock protein PspC (stress-responsive transcriptional regulator)